MVGTAMTWQMLMTQRTCKTGRHSGKLHEQHNRELQNRSEFS